MKNKIAKIEMSTNDAGDVIVSFMRERAYREYAEGQFTNWGNYSFYEFTKSFARRVEIIEKIHAAQKTLFLRSTAPAPLPVDDGMSIHFVNGEVDYIEPGAEVAEYEELDF